MLLTPDEWALTIFGGGDRHQEPGGMRWLLEGRLIALALDVLRLRPSVVLEFGFLVTRRALRPALDGRFGRRVV